MRKVSVLLGAVSGGLAAYVFSNKKLRDDLSKAKDGKAAARILGKHLSNDGEQFAKDVQTMVKSDVVQDKLDEAKKYAAGQYKKARKEIDNYAKMGKKEISKMAKKAKSKVNKAERKTNNM